MWPFAKKKLQTIDLPPLPSGKKPEKDEVELIPETVPGLELSTNTVKESPAPAIAQTREQMPVFPSIPEEVSEERPEIKQSSEIFIKANAHNNVLSMINEIVNDFDSVDFEISRVSDIKESRYSKIDNLQKTLEDVSKNLMNIDDAIFGG